MEYVPGSRAFMFMYQGRAQKLETNNEKRTTKNE
jgi:hypothetical protein